jgi:predicted dehydrogenase
MLQAPQSNVIAKTEVNWRVDPKISGGGLFHDLAPHQLDLMLYYFGKVKKVWGHSGNQAGLYSADDIVSAELLFENNILFKGLWCFTVSENEAKDVCEIIGSEGKISFPVFGSHIILNKNNKEETFHAERLEHVQQPMIERVVNYFLGKEENPCSAEEGAEVMKIMDAVLAK